MSGSLDRPARRATDHVPQPVEVWDDGGWRTALLIGCRLNADNSAAAHLHRLLNGERHDIWRPFDHVRVPSAGSPQSLDPVEPIGRHRADSPVVPDAGSPERESDGLTARLPLSRVSVPPPGGRPSPKGPAR